MQESLHCIVRIAQLCPASVPEALLQVAHITSMCSTMEIESVLTIMVGRLPGGTQVMAKNTKTHLKQTTLFAAEDRRQSNLGATSPCEDNL